MKTKRILSFILILAFLVALLSSCIEVKPATKIEITHGETIYIECFETVKLKAKTDGALPAPVTWSASNANIHVSDDGIVSANRVGETVVTITSGDLSDTITVVVLPVGSTTPTPTPDPTPDPGPDPVGPNPDDSTTDIPDDKYVGMSSSEFYANYTPAINLEDALLRAEEGFMAGSLEVFDGSIEYSTYMPMYNGMFLRNTLNYYSDDGDTYTVVDAWGNYVLRVYRGGGYISLDEVAAYLYAFGDIPANYDPNKNNDYVSSGDRSEWGKYVRLNNSQFKGGYSNEPDMPNITGAGGTFTYREIDIGGFGYNNGNKINRGSYRMVYAHSENGRKLDISERYVFFTQNHYSDFREYLNYYGGWGDIFGYETGGGRVTQRPSVYDAPITSVAETASTVILVAYIPDLRIYR